MPFTSGDLVEITLNQEFLSQRMANVYQYQISGVVTTPTAAQIAEAWWNHVKTTTRAIASNTFTATFRTVTVREMNNPVGELAEWDIPVGEQGGTRTITGLGDYLPPYSAVGVRLLVGSRLTKPGQKRYPFVLEGDNVNGLLQPALRGLVQSMMNVLTADMVLGAPVAGLVLEPIVTRKDALGYVTAFQEVIGYLVNTNLTTQNSRKYGRGI